MAKSLLKSKTFWVNLVVAVLLGLMDKPLGIDPQMEIAAVCMANILLRLLTTEPVVVAKAL
ncbi:hypothetical protein C4573_06815 [Candidatus Woesearchaeota archaeon]|nr:MAG: hypothetical protein C4573_06815 [Candidatus Woesearchaeota archaeon]